MSATATRQGQLRAAALELHEKGSKVEICQKVMVDLRSAADSFLIRANTGGDKIHKIDTHKLFASIYNTLIYDDYVCSTRGIF